MRRRGLALAILFLALYGALQLVGSGLPLLLAAVGTVTTGVVWWAYAVLGSRPSAQSRRSVAGGGGYEAAAIGAYVGATGSTSVDCSSGASVGGFSGDCGGSF
jgi:hypothetical protein